jgi:hypothetical protein
VARSNNTHSDEVGPTLEGAVSVRERQNVSEQAGSSSESNDPAGVLVGIPAYNEEKTVRELVAAASDHADEVVVVDDGSSDETAQAVRESSATLVRHTENQGYGATLKTIFECAYSRNVAHLVILDADGQHDPDDIPMLVSTQCEADAELVTGSRFMGGSSAEMPRYRQFGLSVINSCTNLSLRVGYSYPGVTDSQCGFRAYDDTAIETMATTGEIGSGMGASLDVLFQAAQENYDIAEVPTQIDYDVDNASSRNPLVHGFGLLQSLVLSVLRDRPLRAGGALAAGVATPLIVAVLLLRTTTTTVSIVTTALVSLVLIVGVLFTNTIATRSGRTD